MATATKTARSLHSATNSSAENSSTFDLSTALGGTMAISVANGGTGPSTGCLVTPQISTDGSTWFDMPAFRAGVTASTTYTWVVDLPAAVIKARVAFGSTSQSVTKTVVGHELTSIG